ncbi:MarR family winged helix-turn-helix transcriptional regulator [Thermodesulfobacteriota bacterium]
MESNETEKILKHIVGDCLAVRLRMLNRMVTAIYDEALRPHDIRVTQANILVAVSAYGPATVQQLCRVLHMDTSTLSRAVARIKIKGWLDTEPSGDGKILKIRATPPGFEMIRQFYPAWKGAQEKAAALLGDTAAEAIAAAGNRHLLEGMTG